MLLFQDKELNIMSMVIGVCKTDFCLLVSDTRLVNYTSSGIVVQSDDFPKIARVNDRVLIGTTGTYTQLAGIFDPLTILPSPDTADVVTVVQGVHEYMNKNRHLYTGLMRNYIICGLDRDGRHHIFGVHLDPQTLRVDTNEYDTVAFMPPLGLGDRTGFYDDKIQSIAMSDLPPEEIAHQLGDVIYLIANENKTVNSKPIAQLIKF